MSAVFCFEYCSGVEQIRGRRYSIVFVAGISPGDAYQDVVADEIDNYLKSALTPDGIVIAGLGAEKKKIVDLVSAAEVGDRISGALVLRQVPEVRLILFDDESNCYVVYDKNGDPVKDTVWGDVVPEIRQQGMQYLFKRGGGLLDSSSCHHYRKPSGKHCNKFIRTANVLNDSAEILFIGYWLLPLVTSEVTRVYLDTSSIAPIFYAACQLRQLSDAGFVPPQFESFHSYDGLARARFAKGSLVLVSASTSGDLVDEIEKKRVPRDKIVTVFFLGDSSSAGEHLLCNLTKEPKVNPDGYDPINSEDADRCALCAEGSTPIYIIGDQFLPEQPRLYAQTIKRSSAPRYLQGVMDELARNNIFRINYRDIGVGETRVIDIDVGRLLERRESLVRFNSKLERALKRSIPVKLNRIVHLADPASVSLAEIVRCHYHSSVGRSDGIEVIGVDRLKDAVPSDDASTVVVASCMTNGRDLMDVNRAMRSIQKSGYIVYLVAMARPIDQMMLNAVKSNLTQGDHGAETFRLEVIEHIHLPIVFAVNPWVREQQFLVALHEYFDRRGEEVDAWFGSRIERLRVSTASGLLDDAFLPVANSDQSLRIRENFVFFETTHNTSDVSQADIFVTVMAVLHNWRRGLRSGVEQAHILHHRNVIAPINFDRFNDGVIQVALMRAANLGELHYAEDRELSSQMRDVLRSAFYGADAARGEAALEFLMALGDGRIKLHGDDLRSVLDIAQSHVGNMSRRNSQMMEYVSHLLGGS